MFLLRATLVVVALLGSFIPAELATAQVPPHAPGSICFTQTFWCWAQAPGPVGSSCYCPSAYGWVPGRLG